VFDLYIVSFSVGFTPQYSDRQTETGGQTCRKMDGQTDEQSDGQTDEQSDGQTDGQTV
jgi:hypothetical protein